MIEGLTGHLIPADVVERHLRNGRAGERPARRELAGWRAATAMLGPASSLRAMTDVGAVPLARLLGFGPPVSVVPGRDCLHALLPDAGMTGSLLMTVVPWGASLDGVWREAVVEAGQRGAGWCLLFNGTRLRLVSAGRLFSRRYAEFELDVAADEERTAAALHLLCGAWSVGGPAGGPQALAAMLAEGDSHAVGVCRSLRRGVIEATAILLGALVTRRGAPSPEAALEQALTLVYRLVFLLFAEARALVPLWHPVYREAYSIETLRERSLQARAHGLWDALRAIARLAHAGCRVGSLRVTAFNGRLFSPAGTPLANRGGLDDEAARLAILAVSTRRAADGDAIERVSYRELGVEELGAVYETVLEYRPEVVHGTHGRVSGARLVHGTGTRKATGTFYTPRGIADYLIRDTLAPLVVGAAPERILALKVLDPSMGSGAFLVGACRYLAEAYLAALVEHGRCHASDLGPDERAAARRTVAERCLFGVDLNPTAVQLARLSLWLTTLAADRPLTFLDHHLRAGDSLVGAWVSRLGRPPGPVRRAASTPLFDALPVADTIRGVLPIRHTLALAPNDTAAQVRAKERALAALAAPGSPSARWQRVADTWCAAWLGSPPVPAAAYASLCDGVLAGRSALPAGTRRMLMDRVDRLRAERRPFHWELEFPEVFFDASGVRVPDAGFDAIIGNPPWDMVRADGEGDRDQQRAAAAALLRFVRDSGTYDACAAGHANRYQLFVERAMALTRPGGRLGLVLPFGLLADHGSAGLRRRLFSTCDVDRVVGFENRAALFPIHRSTRFVLLTATSGRATSGTLFRFGETDPATLDVATDSSGRLPRTWFTGTVSPGLLAHLSGPSLAVPDLRSPADLAIAERAATLFAPLGSPRGWHARFGRELNATDDSALFHEGGRGWPVLEGKAIEPFVAHPERARLRATPASVRVRLGPDAGRTRLAYRDVASPGNRVTVIAALLPARTVSTHTLFCLRTRLPREAQQFLCALLNSLVVNFLARLFVSTHVTTAIVERLPVPTEVEAGPAFARLAADAALLARGDSSGVRARLHATVARLYQLSEEEFAHILDRFPLIPETERAAARQAFRRE